MFLPQSAMSRDDDSSMMVPALGSLAIHVVLIIVCAEVFSTYRPWMTGHDPSKVNRFFDDSITIDRSARFGSREGIGFAANASDGARPMDARRAPVDQTLLSRDPAGPGRIGDLPSMSLEPLGNGVSQSAVDSIARRSSPAIILPAPSESPTPWGVGPPVTDVGQPRVSTDPLRIAVTRAADARRPMDAGRPGAAVAPADPAPMSESESDPFSKTGGVDFRAGKMEARFGRDFKSVRPRLSLAAQLDLLGLKSPRIVLKVAIDAEGKVTDVEVLRSTGSKLVDQPVTVAMYQWWFEPAKDATGQPIADQIVFPISWH